MVRPLATLRVTMVPIVPFPFQLAAIDVDDTLLGPEKAISEANRTAVGRLRALGCRVVLASGRRHDGMVRFYSALGLNDFAISCQGARVVHVGTGRILHSAFIGPREAAELLTEGLARGLTVIVWLSQGIYSPVLTPWAEAYLSQTGQDPIGVEDFSVLSRQPAEKIVWVGEPAVLAGAEADARVSYGGRLAVTEARDWCLEFSAREATKAAGLAAIARDANISREAVLAFGDGYNDVSMLRWAGLGVAMAHGHESARSAAHRIGPPGDAGSALARALEGILGPVWNKTGVGLGRGAGGPASASSDSAH